MTKSERNQIIKWANTLTDAELEKEYYDAAFDCLGSDVDEMYERGYDMVDIREREKYEDWLCQKSDVLEELCFGRGIKLWEDAQSFKTSCETCAYYDTDRDDEPCCSCVCEENWEEYKDEKSR